MTLPRRVAGVVNIKGYFEFTDSSFMLKSISICLDAGDTASKYMDIENISYPGDALYPSQKSLRNDIGAYGGPIAKIFPGFSYEYID